MMMSKSFSTWGRVKFFFKTGTWIHTVKLIKCKPEDLKGMPILKE